jgi:hypothetical protein
MKTTCSRVTVIQIFLTFIVGKTYSKNRINTVAIKGIIEDDVLMGLIPYVTTICTISLGLEIGNDIFVLDIIKTDQKRGFVGIGILSHIFCLSGGKVTYQFGENQRFI